MNDIEFLKEANTQDVIKMIIEDSRCGIKEAMESFYGSEIFKKLQNTETGLYKESPAYIYELYTDEKHNKGIVQKEE